MNLMSLKKVTSEKRRLSWFWSTPGWGDGKQGIGFWRASFMWALLEDAGKCSSVSAHLHQLSSQDSGSCTWLTIAPRSTQQYQVLEYSDVLSCSVVSECPMDCSQPGSSVHGIFQTRILEWVAISSSTGFSWPRDQTCISCTGRWILHHRATREAQSDY